MYTHTHTHIKLCFLVSGFRVLMFKLLGLSLLSSIFCRVRSTLIYYKYNNPNP